MKTVSPQIQARAQFIAWLRDNYPEAYAAGFPMMGDANLGDDSGGGFWSNVGDAFTSAVTNITAALPTLANDYVQYQNAQNLITLNAQRANQGLAPLTMNASGQLVSANGYPVTNRDLSLASSGLSTTTWLLIGGGALALILLLKR